MYRTFIQSVDILMNFNERLDPHVTVLLRRELGSGLR
jgi:hypothetical protein